MQFFVDQKSIVRKIWGNADTILFIFTGASAEFALNKAVDWLYFSGKLPADPIGRLFGTVSYARAIIFSPVDEACKAIDTMKQIHASVEQKRGDRIPAWAYRDVLYMLVHYSIAAHELLEMRLSNEEKEEVYNVFYRVGTRMGLEYLPATYVEWLPQRNAALAENLQKSVYTVDLFKQYKKHLGIMRFTILIEAQKLVVPRRVKDLLELSDFSLLTPLLPVYNFSKLMKLNWLRNLLLPPGYKDQINKLDMHSV